MQKLTFQNVRKTKFAGNYISHDIHVYYFNFSTKNLRFYGGLDLTQGRPVEWGDGGRATPSNLLAHLRSRYLEIFYLFDREAWLIHQLAGWWSMPPSTICMECSWSGRSPCEMTSNLYYWALQDMSPEIFCHLFNRKS